MGRMGVGDAYVEAVIVAPEAIEEEMAVHLYFRLVRRSYLIEHVLYVPAA